MNRTLTETTEEKAREIRQTAKALGHKIGRSIEDTWIYAKIGTKLAGNALTEGLAVQMDVVKGVVTLHGDVHSESARRETEMIARDTAGVREVQNHLEVREPSRWRTI